MKDLSTCLNDKQTVLFLDQNKIFILKWQNCEWDNFCCRFFLFFLCISILFSINREIGSLASTQHDVNDQWMFRVIFVFNLWRNRWIIVKGGQKGQLSATYIIIMGLWQKCHRHFYYLFVVVVVTSKLIWLERKFFFILLIWNKLNFKIFLFLRNSRKLTK